MEIFVIIMFVVYFLILCAIYSKLHDISLSFGRIALYYDEHDHREKSMVLEFNNAKTKKRKPTVKQDESDNKKDTDK